jgi:APA family basic amino acid/polyamine antiporter
MTEVQQHSEPGLKRQIGLVTAAAVVVGEVVGVGIFLTPAAMAKSLGSPLLVLAVWLLSGLLALSGALCYGELAARYPAAGGGYVYLREAYGAPLAFLYGWMVFLVLDPGLTAALAVGAASYVGYAAGLQPAGVKALAVASVLALAAVNAGGVRPGGWVVRWLTIAKLALLLFILAWGFGRGLGDWSHFAPFAERRAGSPALGGALAGGLVSAFFSFGGWWDLSKLGGEVREPRRTLPLALALGVLVVTAVYVLTSAAFVYLVAPERVTSGEAFAAQAGEALFGPAGALFFTCVVVVAVLGSLAAYTMSAPRVYFAMARDGLFLRAAARLSPRTGAPVRAVLMQAALACALVLLGTFDEIVSYFLFVVVLFITLTVAGLFVLRRRGPASEYVTPLYPLTPVVYLVLSAGLLFLLAMGSPRQALAGSGVVLSGLPVYYLLARRRAAGLKEEPER